MAVLMVGHSSRHLISCRSQCIASRQDRADGSRVQSQERRIGTLLRCRQYVIRSARRSDRHHIAEPDRDQWHHIYRKGCGRCRDYRCKRSCGGRHIHGHIQLQRQLQGHRHENSQLDGHCIFCADQPCSGYDIHYCRRCSAGSSRRCQRNGIFR